MKKISLLFTLFLFIHSVKSQTIDQQNTGSNTAYQTLYSGANSAQQTFKAGMDGDLHSINLDIEASSCPQITDLNIQVRILDSIGTTVLGLEIINIALPITRSLQQLGFPDQLLLEANHTYQIDVSLPSGQLCDTPSVDASLNWYFANDDTTYAEGNGYQNFSPIGYDYYFITNMTECTTPINANISAIGFEMCQAGNGSVICNASGGGGTLSYLWNTADTTSEVYNLSSNTYSITVTDGGNCMATDSYYLPNAGVAVTASHSFGNTSCYGGNDGWASISVLSGVAPYDYAWSNADTNATNSNLASGIYNYTVTDVNGCTYSDTVSVGQPNELTGSFITTNESCLGNDGFIDLTPIGDFPPFTYSWSHGPTTQDVSTLTAGTYSVTVLDANGCTSILNENILFEAGATIDTLQLDIQNNLCFQSNGHISNLGTAVTTSNPPLVYTLDLQSIPTTGVYNLTAGNYSLIATDVMGCADTAMINIIDSGSPISVNQGSTYTPPCPDACTGTIMVIAGGGSGNYTYSWSNGYTVANGMNLCSGEYTVVVTDDQGCSGSGVMTILPAAPFDVSFNVNEPACGLSDGDATAVINSGGTAPFTFDWNNGDESATADSLAAGNYSVNITDINGCKAFRVASVNSLSGPTVTESLTQPSCLGFSDGMIDLNITGGAAPINVQWSTGHTTEDISSLGAGIYDVTVTDASGCLIFKSFELMNPSAITVSTTFNLASCGGNDGEISITPSGGNGAPYIYQWDSNAGNATTQLVSNLVAGIYEVIVTDMNGCTESFSIALSNDNAPVVNVDQVINPNCQTGGGAMYITASGGTAPYTYLWDNGSTAADLENVSEGNYNLTITDASNCLATASFSLPGINIFAQEICMISVDSLTNMNKVIWEKTPGIGIAEFRVYRETSVAGNYLLVGVIPFDSLSVFQDTVASSDIHAWKYKLATVDSCGNESDFIASHKSIHLITEADINGDVRLDWDDYIGFSYPEFYINRYHSSTGWVVIDTVPNSIHTYFDTNAPNGMVGYTVTVPAPSDCEPTRAGVNTSRSNIRNTPVSAPTEVEEEDMISCSVYPNPAVNELNISLENYKGESLILKMYNAIGELMIDQTLTSSSYRIDTKEIPNGVYTISISSDRSSLVKKVMIVK